MPRQIGDIVLPDQTQWTDRYSWSPIVQENNLLLSGRLVIYENEVIKGRNITLEFQDGVSWLTTSQVQSIVELANSIGASLPLTFDDEVFTVKFRHTEGSAVDFSPIWPENDWHVGTMRLITI